MSEQYPLDWLRYKYPQQPEGLADIPSALQFGGTIAAQGGKPARVILDTSTPDVGEPAIGDGGSFSGGMPWLNSLVGGASTAFGNVVTGLSRDIPRAAGALYNSFSMPEEQAQAQVRDVVGGAAHSLATLPQRAIEASERSRTEGIYDPAPIVEAATLPMGTGAIAGVPVRAGEMVLGAGALRKVAQTAEDTMAARAAIEQKYGTVPGVHPDEAALNINNILSDLYQGPVKPRARNVEEIAADLHQRGSDALKNLGIPEGKIDYLTSTPHSDEIVSRAVAAEIKAAMERGGKTASDWYTKAIDEAMQHAEAIHPELKGDPHQQMAFRAALAITSQGEKVAQNVALAEQVYDFFKKTGKFPTEVASKAGEQMAGNFAKLNQLIADHGPEGARNFLNREFTVKELKDLGHTISGENMNTKVYGSSIFGPKIGQGFFQNLSGNYNPVTMDLWFMRAINRLTGNLVGKADVAPQLERFTNAMREAGMRVPRDPDKLEALARDILQTHERDFKANRALYDSGERNKSELTFSADRLLQNLRGINEQPSGGGHRQWMRDRVERAREILKAQGHDLTNADLQAIWWYPEKDLYGKLGGLPSEGINTDYATVYRNLRAARAARP